MRSIKWLCCRRLWMTLTSQNYSSYYILCCLFCIFIMDECRDFKFDGQVDHIKSQPTDDKPSLKWVWLHHVTNFKFLVPLSLCNN